MGMQAIVVIVPSLMVLGACQRLLPSRTDGDPAQGTGTDRMGDNSEGSPGYLIDPENINVMADPDANVMHISAPPGTVVPKDPDHEPWFVQALFVPRQSLLAGDVLDESRIAIQGGILLGHFEVGTDGAFSGDVALKEDGLLLVSLERELGADFTLVLPDQSELPSTAVVALPAVAIAGFLPVIPLNDQNAPIVVTQARDQTSSVDSLTLFGREHAYAKVGVPWTKIPVVPNGVGPYAFALLGTTAEASIDAASGLITADFSAIGDRQVSVAVRDSEYRSSIFEFTIHVNTYSTCVWIGLVSTEWDDEQNWTDCNNGTPQAIDRVAIDSAAPFQPTITSDTSIDAFGPAAYNGGRVRVKSGITLRLQNTTATVQSSVILAGETESCGTCRVTNEAGDIVVNRDAVLFLQSGINLSVRGGNDGLDTLFIGDGETAGHLVSISESGAWPVITNWDASYWNGVVVQGAPDNPSSANLNGLKIAGNYDSGNKLHLVSHFRVTRFDHVHMAGTSYDDVTMSISDCATGVFETNTWTDVRFDSWYSWSDGSYNISVDDPSCANVGPIAITNAEGTSGGSGYGSFYANDPYGVFVWGNDTSAVCTWTGTIDSDVSKATNWSGCTNGKGDVPSSIDWIIVPPTVNPPMTTSDFFAQGFAAGAGGGQLILGRRLFLRDASQTVASSIEFGGIDDCWPCAVISNKNFAVVNNATMTLGPGVQVIVSNDSGGQFNLLIGDGGTAGHLVANGGEDPALWPTIGSPYMGNAGIRVLGTPITASTVSINGLRSRGMDTVFDFDDYFAIDSLDDIDFGAGDTAGANVVLANCSRGQFNDSQWDGLTFATAFDTGANVDASSCSGPTVSISSALGPGAGEANERDPNGVVNWP